MTRLAVLSDIHFPEHHRQAWQLTLSILPDLNLDRVHGPGDWFDLKQLSKYPNTLKERAVTAEDFKRCEKELFRYRKALPNVRTTIQPGNHEERYYKSLLHKLPELVGVRGHSIQEALDLKGYDIEWIPQERTVEIGKILVVHSDEELKSAGANTARRLWDVVRRPVIGGHWHTEGYWPEGAWVNSCLRTLNPPWAKYNKWTLGFIVVDFSVGGFFYVQPVRFYKRGSRLWTKIGGKEYEM